MAHAAQDDLDFGTPPRVGRLRLQDAETPSRILEQRPIRQHCSVRQNPVGIVVLLGCESAAMERKGPTDTL